MQRSIRFTRAATIRAATIWAATIAAALLVVPASAAPRHDGTSIAPTDVSAQSRPKKRTPQITVRPPRYPYATTSTPYPRAYKFHYPGPNAKRHCISGLVLEPRPSGTVLVPRQRCWWAPG